MTVRRRVVLAATAVLVAAAAVLGVPTLRERIAAAVHWVDETWLDEHVKDGYTRLTSREDWSLAEPLRKLQDYAWLDHAPALVRVAHALGESGEGDANTVAALARSRADGFELFEVDLSLEDGELRCAHDPGAPVRADGCRFETLLQALPRDNAWLVLDIKTDFARTGQRVVDVLRREGRARQIIFQLYRPADFALFNRWQAEADLPGPILTAYLAGRSIHDVADAAQRDGVRVLTLPSWRLPALRHRGVPPGLQVFTHPVHDCTAWQQAVQAGVRGIYTMRGLHCPVPANSNVPADASAGGGNP